MTTPGGGQDRPAGFSSPMGTGNMAKRASAAAAADLAQLASLSEKYKRNMQEAAKAAREVTAEVKKQADLSRGGGSIKRVGVPSIAELRSGSNGFANRVPSLGGSPRIPYQPKGAERLPDGRLDLTGYDTPTVVPRAKELGGGAHMPEVGRDLAPRPGYQVLGGGARMPSLPGGGAVDHYGQRVFPVPVAGGAGSGGGGGQIGGGANMPALPGGGGNGGHEDYARELEPDQYGTPVGFSGGKPNGGGGKIKGAAAKAGAAVFGAMGSALLDTSNYEDADFLANRLALNANGGYNKGQQAQMITKYFGGFTTQGEALNMAMPIINQGGFATGTQGFNTLASNASTIATLNPMLRGQAGQIAMQNQSPQLFNMMRMTTGVETIGRDGKPRPIQDVARELVTSLGGDSRRPMTQDQLSATFGATGHMRLTLQQMGMSEDQIQSYRDVLQADTDKGRFLTAAEVKKHETDAAKTITGSKQEAASARMDLVASHLEEWSAGYQKGTDAMVSAMHKLTASINAMPHAMKEALFGSPGAVAAARDAVTPGSSGKGGFGALLTGGLGAAAGWLLRRGAGPAARTATRSAGALLRAGGGLLERVGLGRAGSLFGGFLGRAGLAAGVHWGLDKFGDWMQSKAGVDKDDSAVERTLKQFGHWAWDTGEGAAEGAAAAGPAGAVAGALIRAGDGAYSWNQEGTHYAAKNQKKSRFGGTLGSIFNKMNPFGDGYGRLEQTQMPSAGWSGVGGAEIGDGEGGGRGPQTYKWLENLMNSGPPHRVTSRIRKGAHTRSGGLSYHATGNAIDLGGPTPGRDTNDLLSINRWLANKLGKAAVELIYSGPGGINLWNGQPHKYKAAVANDHHDHVHVAVTQESLKKIGQKVDGSSTPPSGTDAGSGTAQTHADVQRKHRKGVPGIFQQRNGFSERKLIEHFFDDIHAAVKNVDPDDTDAEGSASSGADMAAPKSNGGAAAPAGSNGGAGRAAIEKFLYGLRLHESGGDYNETSKYSTASGAYQYLDSSWNDYAGYRRAYQAPKAVQDQRARLDVGRRYDKYHNWRLVAAAHFRGDGWVKEHGSDPNAWAMKGPGINPSPNAYVKDVLDIAGIPETGDGYGGAPAVAAMPVETGSQTMEVRRPQVPRPQGGRGSVQVNSHGGSVHIAKVEVHLTTPQVSPQEAKRIGKMVVSEIAQQVKMKELTR